MSTEISAAHEHIELSHNLDIRFDLFHASDIYIMPHWHNALEINFVLDGTFEVTADGQTFLLQSGDCIIINSKVIHATRYVKNTISPSQKIHSGYAKDFFRCTCLCTRPRNEGETRYTQNNPAKYDLSYRQSILIFCQYTPFSKPSV